MMLANANQMLAQYRRKKEIIEGDTPTFIHWEFLPLNQKEETKLTNLTYSYIKSGKYKESVSRIF